MLDDMKRKANRILRIILILFIIFSSGHCAKNKGKSENEYTQAKIEYAKGNLENAKKYFNKLKNNNSEYADIPLYLAKIEYYQGNFEKVLLILEELYEDPNSSFQANLLKLKAEYVIRKERIKILQEVEDLLRTNPENLDLLIMAAKLNAESGKVSQTIMYFERVINQSDKIMVAHKELRDIYEKAGIKERASYHIRKLEYMK